MDRVYFGQGRTVKNSYEYVTQSSISLKMPECMNVECAGLLQLRGERGVVTMP
jgi:hypothetical protein